MTQAGRVYGEALYTLAREEDLVEAILHQLDTLDCCFIREPDFMRLLSAQNLSKSQRYWLLDICFREKVNIYVLHFLKILTGKGHIRHFSHCVAAFRKLYNQDNGILPVTAVTAVALTAVQSAQLTERLHVITGKRIALTNQLDPTTLGGIRLDLDGERIDGTLAHRLAQLRNRLNNTTL